MKSTEIKALFDLFEQVASEYEGIECWSARKLQALLGYSKWENFSKVIEKAKSSCENAGQNITDHFPDVRKMVQIGSGAEKEIDDILLTRTNKTSGNREKIIRRSVRTWCERSGLCHYPFERRSGIVSIKYFAVKT